MARLGGGVAMQGVSERLTASAIGSMPGGDHRIIAAASGMLVAVIGSESTVGIMPTTRGGTAAILHDRRVGATAVQAETGGQVTGAVQAIGRRTLPMAGRTTGSSTGITAHTLITGTATGGIGQAGRTSAVFQEVSAVVHTAAGIVARR